MNAHDPVLGITVLIVPHPFAIWTLLRKFVSRDETFEGNFSMGRDRQSCELTVDDFNGSSAHASRPIQLAFAIARPLHAGRKKQQRIGSHDCDNGTGLAPLHVFFFDDSAVVRGSSANADAVFIEY